jgi:PPOX class probable FMN-dependent enzyme
MAKAGTDHVIQDEGKLREVYAEPSHGAVAKELTRLDPHCKRFIELSPFFCLGSSRADGLGDVSPRGGEPGFVHVLDETTLAIPDRPGNNRLDSLTNLLHNSAVGLLFFLPGVNEMLRINGVARLSVEPALMKRFEMNGKPPRSVMLVDVKEAYLHCAKAVARSGLWKAETQIERSSFPTAGEIFRDQMKLDVPAKAVDEALDENTRTELY